MVTTKTSLINALSVIRELCRSVKDCDQCPLYDDTMSECNVSNKDYCPEDWQLAEPDQEWRAFK